MRLLLLLSLLIIRLHAEAQTREFLDWQLRAEQNSLEDNLFRRLTNYKDSTYPKSFGLLDANDTIRYDKGKTFRTCEVSENRLNGSYRIYYPDGTIYCRKNYKDGMPADTAYYYAPGGSLMKKVFWKTPLKSITWFYTKEQTLKKKYISKYPDKTSGNMRPKEKRYYYNRNGEKISLEEYYSTYGDDKDSTF